MAGSTTSGDVPPPGRNVPIATTPSARSLDPQRPPGAPGTTAFVGETFLGLYAGGIVSFMVGVPCALVHPAVGVSGAALACLGLARIERRSGSAATAAGLTAVAALLVVGGFAAGAMFLR